MRKEADLFASKSNKYKDVLIGTDTLHSKSSRKARKMRAGVTNRIIAGRRRVEEREKVGMNPWGL